jgi:ADP-ribosylglycohydrolase
MGNAAIQDRAAGAIMGAFIGDALGLGPHWYYDLEELRRDYGDWITTYTDPKPGAAIMKASRRASCPGRVYSQAHVGFASRAGRL